MEHIAGARRVPAAADPAALGFDADKLAGTRRLIQKYIDRGKIAGAVSLVARRGQVAQLLAVGHAELESGTPMAPDTLFRIFSLTKPVTSVAALMLVERGLLALDAPVEEYIPAFRGIQVFVGQENGRLVTEPARRPPTVRHLLTQTSGIAGTAMPPAEPLAALYREARIGDESLTLEETVNRLARIPLLFHPGERWRYGVSTDVLARVIEVASGMHFGDFLREHVFAPLGMHDTGFTVPADKRHRLAALYSPSPSGGLRPMRGLNPAAGPAAAPAAGAAAAPAAGVAGPTAGPTAVSTAEPTTGPTTGTVAAPTAGPAAGASPADKLGPRPSPAGGVTGPVLQSGSSGLVSTVLDYYRFAQMLLDGGTFGERRLLHPETVAAMRHNQLPDNLLPYQLPWPHTARYTRGCGFGFGVRVVLDVQQWGVPGSVGEFGWAGAANTYLWIDPAQQVVALLFAQAFPFMHTSLDTEFKALVYEALRG